MVFNNREYIYADDDNSRYLLSNSIKKHIVKKYKNEAADYICSKYSWDDVVRQTTDLYEKKEN